MGHFTNVGRWSRNRRRILALAASVLAILMGLTWRPLRVSYDIFHSRNLLKSRQAVEALPVLEAAARRNPEQGQIQFLLARCQRRLGRMDKAREHLAKAWKLRFPQKNLIREEWLALAQSGQMRDADPHLAELLINPGDDGPEICEAYVNGYFLTNRFREAFDLLDVWQEAFPQDSQPYLFRGRYHESRSSPTEAIADYRRGLQRDAKHRDLQLNLARCLVVRHEHDEAAQILKRLQTETPNAVEVLEVAGQCLLQQGQLDESRQVLTKLLELSPQHALGRLLLARWHLQERQNPEALQLLEELAAERSFDIEVRYSFALALQQAGDDRRAGEEFRFVVAAREAMIQARQMVDRVVTKEPQNSDLRYRIGVILLQYESPEAGAGWLRSVLELDPQHRLTHRALAEYYEKRHFTELARTHREKLRTLGDQNSEASDPLTE